MYGFTQAPWNAHEHLSSDGYYRLLADWIKQDMHLHMARRGG